MNKHLNGHLKVITARKAHPYISTALKHVSEDFAFISGVEIQQTVEAGEDFAIYVGTIGLHPQIDGFITEGAIDVSAIEGQWEAFRILSLPEKKAFAVIGADPRGTAYGLYALSEHFGVSPWHWFADVTPHKMSELDFSDIDITWKPSVRYRGIFINDERWGMQEWAKKNFASGEPLMGAKVYRRVFEVMMRLKANTIWPSMWGAGTKRDWPGFFLDPQNLQAAQEYGVVMAASHGEALNATPVEWLLWADENDESDAWNYGENFDAMKRFWKDRLAVSSLTESLYTIGLRGLNDEPMSGGSSFPDKIKIVEEALQTQRQLLREAHGKPAEEIPQIFTPYKEVLELFEAGLEVPDDVTILYSDDDFGYLEHMPTLEPRKGGYGMYYHGDYYGGPKSYLWLAGPALELMRREMRRTFDLGILNTWMINVGNLKAHELSSEYYIHLAGSVGSDSEMKPKVFIHRWAKREFGEQAASVIADSLHALDTVNYLCKPDHSMPGRFGSEEGKKILKDLESIAEKMEAARQLVPGNRKDAFDQLVRYPVLASQFTHSMMIYETEHLRHRAKGHAIASHYGKLSTQAYDDMAELTRYFNEEMSGGKWDHFMKGPQGGHNWEVPWQPKFERHKPDISEVELNAHPSGGIWIKGQSHPIDASRSLIDSSEISIDSLDLVHASEKAEIDWSRFDAEVTLIPDSLSEDFSMSFEVKPSDQIAVVYGYENGRNFYWTEFVCDSVSTQSAQLIDGTAVPVVWNETLRMPRNTWSQVRLIKQRDLLQIFLGTELVMMAQGQHIESLRGQLGFAIRKGKATIRELAISIYATSASQAATLPTFVKGRNETRAFEIFSQSESLTEWSTHLTPDWVHLSKQGGHVREHELVDVSVDWDKLSSAAEDSAQIEVRVGDKISTLHVSAIEPGALGMATLIPSIKTRLSPVILKEYQTQPHPTRQLLEGIGRDGVMLPLAKSDLDEQPCLSIPLEFTEEGTWEIQVHILPTREHYPEKSFNYAISVNGEKPQVIDMLIRKNCWNATTLATLQRHAVMAGFHTGRSYHAIKNSGVCKVDVWALNSGIDLEGIDIRAIR